MLGREVEVGRLARITGVLRPELEVQDLVVLHDPVTRHPFASIEAMEIGLDLRALLERRVRIEWLHVHGMRASLGTDASGSPLWPLELRRRTPESDQRVRVVLDRVDLDDSKLSYQDGRRGRTTTAWIEALEVEFGDEDHAATRIHARGELEGMPLTVDASARRPEGGAADAPYRVEGFLGMRDATVHATGSVESPNALSGTDLALEASGRLPVLEAWSERFGLEVIEGSARLTDFDGDLRLSEIELRLGSEGHRLDLAGEIDDLAGQRLARLEAKLELAQVPAFSPIHGFSVGELEAVRGRLELRAQHDRVHAEAIDVAVESADGVRARVRGTLSDLTGLGGLDLEARVEAPHLQDLTARFHPELHPELRGLGPVHIEARAVGAGNHVTLSEIDARIGSDGELEARARGELELIGGAHDLALDVELRAPSSTAVEPWLEFELPELGPLHAWVKLRGTVAQAAIEEATIRAGEELENEVTLRGRRLHLPLDESFEVDLELRAPTLSGLEPLTGFALPDRGPVRASGTVRVAPGIVAAHDLRARVAGSELTGAASTVLQDDGRRRSTLSLASASVDMEDFLRPIAEADVEREAIAARDRRLPVELLRDHDVEVLLDFERVLGRAQLTVEDVAVRLLLADGNLALDPISFAWQGAELDARAGVDARSEEPAWRLRARADGVPLQTVAAQFTDAQPVEGEALFLANLESHGERGQEVLEGLEGDFSLALRDAVLRGDYVLLLRRDLVSALALKPLRKDEARARCLVGAFVLEDGAARTQALFLDGDSVLLEGTGFVDLGREEVDLVLTPKAKRPGLGLMQPVVVSGSLAEPKVRPLKRALVKHAAKAVIGNLVVPGVGTIAPFLQTGTFGRDPCEQAIEAYLED